MRSPIAQIAFALTLAIAAVIVAPGRTHATPTPGPAGATVRQLSSSHS